jgi:predicted metal-dependent hydrolase
MFRAIYNKLTSRSRVGVATDYLEGVAGLMPIEFRKRRNARRYILRMNAAGNGGCVTIPRGGSIAEARSFAKRNARWLEDRLRRAQELAKAPTGEDRIWFRGEEMPVTALERHESLNVEKIRRRELVEDVNARIKLKLWQLAWKELPARLGELAARYGLTVRRVSVRDQRSRWGSCSARGVVSLNWRLVQTPDFVRDYIIVHELMHLREMNHSHRFWKLVHDAFPRTEEAEKWLKEHSALLRRHGF